MTGRVASVFLRANFGRVLRLFLDPGNRLRFYCNNFRPRLFNRIVPPIDSVVVVVFGRKPTVESFRPLGLPPPPPPHTSSYNR